MTPKLEKTTDYSLFEVHELNRNLHNSSALEKSMRKHGFRPSSPIHVIQNKNGKLKVKRGHNRLAVAMKLGLPVWYIVDNDSMSIYDWEGDSCVRWEAEDFAVSYMRGGSDDCRILMNFKKRHNLTIGTAASLVGGECATGSGNQTKKLKAGTFRVGDMTHAYAVAEIIDFCKDIGIEFANKSAFVSAISASLLVPGFDAKIFKARAKRHPKMMGRRTNRADYLIEIETLYNHGTHGKRLPIAVRAHEMSLERQRTFGRACG